MIYDLIVLGGGPAGYLACERAGHAGLKVLLIEKENIGGVCLNRGCIPTKTLLYSAKIKDSAEHGKKYGVIAKDVTIDHAAVIKRKNKVVKKLVSGVKSQVKGSGTTIVDGEGTITGTSADGYSVLVNDETYTAKRLLIATGSSPIIPPIEGLKEGIDSSFVATSREMLELMEVPKKLIVIGGGVIGLEMASYYNSAGSDVIVIEMLPTIGGTIDSDIAELLKKEYTKKGITFNLSSKVTKVNKSSVVYEKDGESIKVSADKVLLSVGRKPNSNGIGLENINVEVERGAIKIDERCMTNIANVYCAGDVNAKSMLAHTAYRQAEVAVNNMLGRKDIMRYSAIPGVIYTNPEVAGVGHTKKSAEDLGMNITEKAITMNYSGRYMAENERGEGIIKIIVDNEKNTLCGVHIIGNYASEIIISAGIMIEKEMSINEIKELIFPHPTVSEAIREAIFQL
ncbi:MAG: dihydrolipoyl dehydrogenase [Clostridiales bacterium]|nr:dihydrolipoyl dehydrogenase [Clostridiales bacterium]